MCLQPSCTHDSRKLSTERSCSKTYRLPQPWPWVSSCGTSVITQPLLNTTRKLSISLPHTHHSPHFLQANWLGQVCSPWSSALKSNLSHLIQNKIADAQQLMNQGSDSIPGRREIVNLPQTRIEADGSIMACHGGMCKVWETWSEAIVLQLLQGDVLQVRVNVNLDSLSTR